MTLPRHPQLDAVLNAARLAGGLLREGFGTAFGVSSKDGRHNLVTEYDIASEAMIKRELFAADPTIGFLGEESGGSALSAERLWVVDPLDGTVNFSRGVPIFCISIALVESGTITLGVIFQPLHDEMFVAVKGQGAWKNNKPLHVSNVSTLHDSFLVTGFPYNVNDDPEHCIEQFATIVRLGAPVRRLGSAALDMAYVAAGHFDGFWEVRLHPWDVAAGAILVEEAGGVVTHYNGRTFELGHNSIIATNGKIHGELVSKLRLLPD